LRGRRKTPAVDIPPDANGAGERGKGVRRRGKRAAKHILEYTGQQVEGARG